MSEIILMLLGSFVLGYILRMMTNRGRGMQKDEIERLQRFNHLLTSELETLKNASNTSANASERRPDYPDDLKKIDGIGPKVEVILNDGGIWTFDSLAKASQERLMELLDAAFPINNIHTPKSWPEQAAHARDGSWDILQKWQEERQQGM